MENSTSVHHQSFLIMRVNCIDLIMKHVNKHVLVMSNSDLGQVTPSILRLKTTYEEQHNTHLIVSQFVHRLTESSVHSNVPHLLPGVIIPLRNRFLPLKSLSIRQLG